MKNKVLTISFIVFIIGIIIWLTGSLGVQYHHSQFYNYFSNLGLFLTLFGIVIIFVYSFFMVIKEGKEFQVSTEKIICPSCSRSISFYSNICPYCRYKFIKGILTQDESEKNMKELKRKLKSYNKVKICFLCGFKLNGTENFCPDCGYRL